MPSFLDWSSLIAVGAAIVTVVSGRDRWTLLIVANLLCDCKNGAVDVTANNPPVDSQIISFVAFLTITLLILKGKWKGGEKCEFQFSSYNQREHAAAAVGK